MKGEGVEFIGNAAVESEENDDDRWRFGKGKHVSGNNLRENSFVCSCFRRNFEGLKD